MTTATDPNATIDARLERRAHGSYVLIVNGREAARVVLAYEDAGTLSVDLSAPWPSDKDAPIPTLHRALAWHADPGHAWLSGRTDVYQPGGDDRPVGMLTAVIRLDGGES